MINIVLEDARAKPHVGSEEAAGMDLRLAHQTSAGFTAVAPGETLEASLGIRVGVPKGWVGILAPRSGLGTKFHVRLANTIGVIDSDYVGVVKAFITNGGREYVYLEDFERVCQLIVVPHYDPRKVEYMDKLPETARGTAGFGSTGSN
jgi:dUTP pyrophosphatase